MRRALVLSPAAFSATTGRAIMCPIAEAPKGNPFEVKLPAGVGEDGVVLADRITSVDVRACGVRLVRSAVNDAVTAVREKLLALVDFPLE